MKKWSIVAVLALAQFVMVLDSTVMNVSISTVVSDLDTSVSALQTAITFYTLTMAAFMLTGGKLGDKLGVLKAFRIGSIIYGLGSLITAVSPSIGVLFFGWSIVEGLGAVLVIPAIAALIAMNYRGKDRVVGYMLIGAASGVAVALGPLIGGYMTTYLSWRYVFAAETLVMVGVLLFSLSMSDQKSKVPVRIDYRSVLQSAAGMTILVYGILQSKTWGWIAPKDAPQIGQYDITPFGISIVAYLIMLGLYILYLFYKRQLILESTKKSPLLSVSMLSIKPLRSGLAVLGGQYIITAAIFFVIPIYLQMVLGYDALETGKRIFPLSVALVIFSIAGSKLIARYNPRQIIRFGQWGLVVGTLLLTGAINPEMKGFLFGLALFVVGAGLGLLASQIGNVTMSSAPKDKSSEVGGLQGAFQNLGASLGTAVIGSVMIATLTTGFVDTINANPNVSESVKTSIEEKSSSGIPIASDSDVEAYALLAGLSEVEASDIAADYKQSQIQSLRSALFFLVLLALFTTTFSKNIPTKKVA